MGFTYTPTPPTATSPVDLATQAELDAVLDGQTFTGELVAPDFYATGKTGATGSPGILAGGTTSGAPASGAHVVGEVAVAADGVLWICTVAGTPGTWVDGSSSGQELAYAQVTSGNLTNTGIGQANRIDATGLTISPTVGTRPIIVDFYSQVFNATVNDGVGVAIQEGSTILQIGQMASAGFAGSICPMNVRVRLTPSAGAHTYKITFWAVVGGTATITNASTSPSFIRALNC